MILSGILRCVVPALLLAGFAGCTGDRPIGVLLPNTGPAEVYGRAVGDGISLALVEAEECAVLPKGCEVFEADTTSQPRIAAAELQRLVNEHDVAIVVGGVTTDEAAALIPVVEKNHVVCVSPSAPASDLASRSRYFFRLFATDEVEGSTAARHLFSQRSVRKVVVVTDDSVFTRGIETKFRQHFEFNFGGEIVATIHTSVEFWKSQLSDALHAHDPRAVYVVGHGETTLKVLEQLHDIHFGGVRCTTSSLYLTHVISRGGAAAEGAVFPLIAFDIASENDPVHGFVDRFRSHFGEPPDIYAAHGYDAMRVAIRTMVHARAHRPRVLRQYMTIGLRDFTGVTGAVAFDERGDVRRYPVMHQIWNQRVVRSSWLDELRDRARKEIIESLQPEPTPQV